MKCEPVSQLLLPVILLMAAVLFAVLSATAGMIIGPQRQAVEGVDCIVQTGVLRDAISCDWSTASSTTTIPEEND